ncbi:hypothetical protein TOPH_02145 [Tolypocladium ophioglossoides CBS 100239]|uniref:Uncharacterized protein n=1 Tax=Tolypocladium ophioglossoides (strain CBS 100239) TaxID=1163406 RepID=A0A0L0NH09_TOLOC|nr:hypothetical protein TOPH_02145 [Tolypocladium ophioglossoides CBS 100239]
MFTGGLYGTTGLFNYGINSHENVICYNIRSMVSVGSSSLRPRHPLTSAGGPFLTDVVANEEDTGDGFHVKQIEQNQSSFFTEVSGQLGGRHCQLAHVPCRLVR